MSLPMILILIVSGFVTILGFALMIVTLLEERKYKKQQESLEKVGLKKPMYIDLIPIDRSKK